MLYVNIATGLGGLLIGYRRGFSRLISLNPKIISCELLDRNLEEGPF